MACPFSNILVVAVAAWLLISSALLGTASPIRRIVEADYQHVADEYGDIPPDMPDFDKVPPTDGPSAQAMTVPLVTQSGSTYTWLFNDFSSKTLGPFNVISDTWGGASPNMNREWAPDPLSPSKLVFKVKYPAGTTTPSSIYNPPGVRGGTGFYGQPIAPTIVNKAKVWTLEYSVYFPPDFQWVRGGKLPGLYGGVPGSRSCSGGSSASDCFSARYMWRRNGDGEAYVYVPTNATQDPGYCSIPPTSVCDPGYGDSIARGSIKFQLGKWTRIKQTISLNTVGKLDGVLKLAMNGMEVLNYNKMVWRIRPDVVPQGIMFQTFFGGSTADWATPNNTYTMYKDFTMTVTV